ncbi:MAG: hypothetical protein NTW96_02960 [Planctomycetia bacterium]|nr:hypothetical protein [Planctomycetia bacterium]
MATEERSGQQERSQLSDLWSMLAARCDIGSEPIEKLWEHPSLLAMKDALRMQLIRSAIAHDIAHLPFSALAGEPHTKEKSGIPIASTGQKQQDLESMHLEIEELRLQNDRLKTLATQDRRVAARESQRYDELLRQHEHLSETVDRLKATLVEKVDQLARVVGADRQQVVGQRQFDLVMREFYRLTAVWKTTTIHVSNLTEKCSHPAYKQIVAMGTTVLPFIFAELEREPDHWFAALRALTGVNPVPSQSRGKLKETTEAWLKWAKYHGFSSGHITEEEFSATQLEHVFQEERSDT